MAAAATATTTDLLHTGHTDMIHDAQYDYYGRYLATCSSDGGVRVFSASPDADAQEQAQLAVLTEHSGPVWSVAWSHPRFGTTLASASYDGRVCVWQEKTAGAFTKMYEFKGHKSSVNKVEWAPHQHGNAALATCSSDSSISILTYNPTAASWHIASIPDAHQLGVNTVAWEPVTTTPRHRIASGGADRLLKVWVRNDETGAYELEQTVVPEGKRSYPDWVRDVAYCPAPTSASSTLACCSGNMVFIWRRHDAGGKSQHSLLATLTVPDLAWKVSWSEHNGLLAVTCANDNVYVFKNVNVAKPSDWQQIAVQPLSPPHPQQQQAQAQQQQQHHHHHHHHHQQAAPHQQHHQQAQAQAPPSHQAVPQQYQQQYQQPTQQYQQQQYQAASQQQQYQQHAQYNAYRPQ